MESIDLLEKIKEEKARAVIATKVRKPRLNEIFKTPKSSRSFSLKKKKAVEAARGSAQR